jgi:hypothetical protein
MTALLSKVAIQRAWEEDAHSPAKSYRSEPAASAQADNHAVRTDGGASPGTTAPGGTGAPRRHMIAEATWSR